MMKIRKKQLTRLILQMNYTSVRYKTPERIRSRIWIFHKDDTDLQPSVLHGHSQDDNYRLDAMTGMFYRGDDLDKNVGTLTDKELRKLHNNKRFQEFAIERILWVNEHAPRAHFSIPEWACSRIYMTKCMLHKKQKESQFILIV